MPDTIQDRAKEAAQRLVDLRGLAPMGPGGYEAIAELFVEFAGGEAAYSVQEPFAPFASAVAFELQSARAKFPKFNSAHEGYAILLEEVDELWEEVRRKNRSDTLVLAELIQVAAMARRFAEDICGYGLEATGPEIEVNDDPQP